jgi:hypothetical protein
MGATLALWTLALGRVSLASAVRGLYGLAVPDTAQEISPMAEPRRAAATAPRFEGGRFLIVEARYYDAASRRGR